MALYDYQGNEIVSDTDKTLTIENIPADAKKVGDELTALEGDLSDLQNQLNNLIDADDGRY